MRVCQFRHFGTGKSKSPDAGTCFQSSGELDGSSR